MSSKDVNDMVASGASLTDLVSRAVSAHRERATQEVARIRDELAGSDDQVRTISDISKKAAVAIGNAAKRDKKWTEKLLSDLSRDIEPAALDILAKDVEEYVKSGLVVHNAEVSRTVGAILDGVGNSDYRIPSGLVCPHPWEMHADGLFKLEKSKDGEYLIPVCPVPIVPTGLLKDSITGKEYVVISWCIAGKWGHVITPRADATTRRKLETWSDYGIPVSSSSSGHLSEYIADMIVENYTSMPRAGVSMSMGWQRDNESFLAGRTMITKDALIRYDFDIMEVSPVVWEKDAIYFMSPDAGNSQLAEALTQSGKLSEWQQAISFLNDKPRARAAVVFAMCAPMLHILRNTVPFTIDWGGGTSRGKSTTLLYAASVWGLGQEEANRYFGSWDTTRTNVERTLSTLRHIPLVIDDTKKARRKEDVSKVIYDITSGIGRGRASPSGLQVSGHYRTVMLTTGEARVTSFSRDGGAFTRVLQFFGSPMDKVLSQKELIELRKSQAKLTINYGLAGPLFVQKLLANQDSWPKLQSKFDELIEKWSTMDCLGGPASSYASRLAKYAALFELTSMLAEKFVGVQGFSSEEYMKFWTEWNRYAEDADQSSVALTFICNRVMLERNVFWEENGKNDRVPFGGWRGILPASPSQNGIYLERSFLERLLRKNDYDVANIVSSWVERGWLTPYKGRLEHPKTVSGFAVQLLHIGGHAVRKGLALGQIGEQ